MPFMLCALWLVLLGAALAGPLYWLLQRRTGERPAAAQPAPHPPAPAILFLSPACSAALGACAAPARLRNMSAACIARRLKRAVFSAPETMPAPEQYATWPEQARLLCAGARTELAALQHKLRLRFGVPEPHPGATHKPGRPAPPSPAWPLALTLALLWLSLLSWWAAAPCKGPACAQASTRPPVAPVAPVAPVPSVPLVPPVATITLSTDLVFDYKRSTPLSKAHEAKTKEALKQLFHQFDGITIRSIEGHTDPIGTSTDNQLLGQQRGQFMRALIQKLIDHPERPQQFDKHDLPPVSADSGPQADDFDIWSACFGAYYLHPKDKPRATPLVNLAPAKGERRLACDRADASTGSDGRFPACARMPLPKPGTRLGADYAYRAERLREVVACLAPMRHVLITFQFEHVLPAAVAPGVTQSDRGAAQ